jgi:hypothetical protein
VGRKEKKGESIYKRMNTVGMKVKKGEKKEFGPTKWSAL